MSKEKLKKDQKVEYRKLFKKRKDSRRTNSKKRASRKRKLQSVSGE